MRVQITFSGEIPEEKKLTHIYVLADDGCEALKANLETSV